MLAPTSNVEEEANTTATDDVQLYLSQILAKVKSPEVIIEKVSLKTFYFKNLRFMNKI